MAAFRGRGRHQVALAGRRSGKTASAEEQVRAAGLSGTRVFAAEARNQQFSKALEVDMSGAVCRAIAQLPPIYQAWLRHRYKSAGVSQREASRHFDRLFWTLISPDLVQVRSATRIGVLLLVRYLVRETASDRPFRHIPAAEARAALEVSERAWSRTYARHWANALIAIRQIDEIAIEAVLENVTQVGKKL